MRRVALFLILLAATLPALAEDWTTNDGRTYKDVTVVGQEEDGVRINYDGGVGKVFYSDMPLALQKRFGQDPVTLAAKKKAADQALAQQAAAAAAEAARMKAVQAARNQGTMAPGQPTSPGEVKPVLKMPNPNQPQPYSAPAVNNRAPSNPGVANPYPGAKYSYDVVLDKSYLDSLDIALDPQGGANGNIGAVVLRIDTDGREPQNPEQIEAILLTAGNPARLADVHDMSLIVNGKSTPLTATPKKDSSIIPFSPPGYSSFDLTTDQARAFRDRSTELNIGGTVYKVSDAGSDAAEGYFSTMGHLPPASPSIVKMFRKFIAGIPSVATMISALCGYVFLGAFGIFVTGFVVIMIIGIVRFINVG